MAPTLFVSVRRGLLGRGTEFLTKAGEKERGVARLQPILRPSPVGAFRADFRFPYTVRCRETKRQLPDPMALDSALWKWGSCVSTATPWNGLDGGVPSPSQLEDPVTATAPGV